MTRSATLALLVASFLCGSATVAPAATQDSTPHAAAPIVSSAGEAGTAEDETLSDPRYRIGTDDLLTVAVLQAPELNVTARVNERGEISLPLLGAVKAAGLTTREFELALEGRLRERYIREPDVTVQVSELQSKGISIMGAVRRPGVFQVRGSRSLLEVLSLAGGLADDAGDAVIVLRGGGPDAGAVHRAGEVRGGAAIEVPLTSLLQAAEGANVAVHPGDVVNVQAAAIVYVVGAIRRPGAFAMRGNDRLTVLRALAMGEGVLPTAAGGDAVVLRTLDTGERVELAVDLGDVLKGRAPDMPLEPQDVLFVPTSGSKAVARATIDALTRLVTFRGVLP
jgi:polysaccharide biosynthesis/export protein